MSPSDSSLSLCAIVLHKVITLTMTSALVLFHASVQPKKNNQESTKPSGIAVITIFAGRISKLEKIS
uniref:Uncharacterized protein n=1 Tax=Arundo donax TaxID=35708 RepID=A0A0A8XP62_ARUDO